MEGDLMTFMSRRSLLISALSAATVTWADACAMKREPLGRKLEMNHSALEITVEYKNVQRAFKRTLLGEGLIMGFSYMWDQQNQRMWPGLMEKIKALDADFFGHLGGPGVWVHDYHWKECIGPMEKRKDPTPRFHHFDEMNGLTGTHEYGMMLEEYRHAIGREVLGSIQVNIMTGTAEEAADWVEYMNGSPKTKWGSVRADQGHREPFNVQYWELGNQPHYTFANVGRLTGVEYSKRVRKFTMAMKQRDPNIKVTAYLPFFAFDGTVAEAAKLGTYIEGVPGAPGKERPTWTELVLQEAGDIIDALDWHWYGAVNTRYHSYEYIMSSVFDGLHPNIERARKVIKESAPTDEARERLSQLVCPEYGAISNNSPVGETATTIYGAVANSRLLHYFLTRDDLRYAARFGLFAPYPEPKMINDVRTPYMALFGRTDGSDFMGTAIYEMKLLWARAYLPQVVSANMANSPEFSTKVPVLDVSALRSTDRESLNLILTNTGNQSLDPQIEIKDFKPESVARLLMISGDLYDDNRWDSRTKVSIQENQIQVGQKFRLTLPPNSIAAVLMKQS